MKYDKKYKQKVIERGDGYNYLWTYERGDVLSDRNKIIGVDIDLNYKKTYLRVKCPFCLTEYDVEIQSFFNGSKCAYCCNKYENSFAYHIQIELGESLNKYWDWEKNEFNPYLLSKGSHKKIWIKCTETDYHGSYEIQCINFKLGKRCSYCHNTRIGKVHILDSFGSIYPNKSKMWDNIKNKVSPYNVPPHIGKPFWFICSKCGKSFTKIPNNIHNDHNVYCNICNKSKGEEEIKIILEKYNIEYDIQKKFDNLLGLGGGNLSYDFYLHEYNLLIEYQGEFHDGTAITQSEKQYSKQIIHDKRKRKYSEHHNIKLLEIWYWDYDNIEEILIRELELIQ